MDSGSTAFIIICAALVFIMTPGLGFFYGGLGRRKNVVSNMMNSVFIMGLGMVLWALLGYTISFGGDAAGHGGFIIGGFNHIGLSGITSDTLDFNGTTDNSIPAFVFCAFQMMFAIITPAIITGSLAGRMKFKALFFFIAIWSIVVYYPMAHMVWGDNGILGVDHLGSVDFAGGNVVHVASGVSGLVLCMLLGRRHGYENQSYRTHNIPFIMLGMGLLWLGWFGFNAGSALEANGQAAHAFMTTAISAATALLSWMLMDVIVGKKATLIGASTGAIVGLVGITPGAGFVPIWAAFIIGALVSPTCYFGIVVIKRRLMLDDALDAFGCHGIGGIFGGLMTGLFAQSAVGGTDGLFFGNPWLVGKQFVAIIVSIAVAAAGSLICASIVKLFTPLRVARKNELMGLDISEHGENAYPSYMGLD